MSWIKGVGLNVGNSSRLISKARGITPTRVTIQVGITQKVRISVRYTYRNSINVVISTTGAADVEASKPHVRWQQILPAGPFRLRPRITRTATRRKHKQASRRVC